MNSYAARLMRIIEEGTADNDWQKGDEVNFTKNVMSNSGNQGPISGIGVVVGNGSKGVQVKVTSVKNPSKTKTKPEVKKGAILNIGFSETSMLYSVAKNGEKRYKQ